MGEQSLAVEGDSTDMEDRVNNRTLRPVSSTFREFMTEGWESQEPQPKALESSAFTPARLQSLSERGQSEDTEQRLRLRLPSGYDIRVLHGTRRGFRSRSRAGPQSCGRRFP